MPFADVNGQHIYFEDSGGSGTPVIFSHGYLMEWQATPREEILVPFRTLMDRDDI
jgi:3-oxoadipate enol-lactonase